MSFYSLEGAPSRTPGKVHNRRGKLAAAFRSVSSPVCAEKWEVRALELPSLLCPLVLHRGSGWNHRFPAVDSLPPGVHNGFLTRPPLVHG